MIGASQAHAAYAEASRQYDDAKTNFRDGQNLASQAPRSQALVQDFAKRVQHLDELCSAAAAIADRLVGVAPSTNENGNSGAPIQSDGLLGELEYVNAHIDARLCRLQAALMRSRSAIL